MPNVFFYSDPHLGHRAMVEKYRHGFSSVEHHDQFIVDKINSRVRPVDLLWILGDVAFTKESLAVLNRINGRKKLVLGNHDQFHVTEYAKYFDEIYGVVRNYHGLVLSHVPIHPKNLELRWQANVHGHIHDPEPYNLDEKYVNVCADVIHFTPISLDEVRQKLKGEGNDDGRKRRT